jgi:hypothetical protein
MRSSQALSMANIQRKSRDGRGEKPVSINKAGDANGGLKWLQKGGGYYSQCVKKLKSAA